MTNAPSNKLLEEFVAIVGKKNALTDNENLTRYTHENRNIHVGVTPLVLKPANTLEVSNIMKLANETLTPIVPQGGHTGHAAGAVPSDDGTQIVLSMERMNKIRELDLQGNTAVVEAGVILQSLQERADENDRLFPLSLAAQGSCQIGGNISTNAGGTGVLAYGNMRDLVLGLEVVFPSGEIWNGLKKLKKDNTGYDIRDLIIGAEGTLGVITAAVVKMYTKPKGREVAIAGFATPEQALALFNHAQSIAGQTLTGFELMPRFGVEITCKHNEQNREPLIEHHNWYALVEISSGRSQQDAKEMMGIVLSHALKTEMVSDAVIAQNESQRDAFWALRENLPPSQKFEGGSIKHDISVAVHLIPEFLERAGKIIAQEIPIARICSFGHMGDGNLHYNITQPEGADTDEFLSKREHINDLIHDLVIEMEGSISAEHGIGLLKRDLLARTKQPVELEMMKSIKEVFDPKGIMNPGKVL